MVVRLVRLVGCQIHFGPVLYNRLFVTLLRLDAMDMGRDYARLIEVVGVNFLLSVGGDRTE